MALTAPDDAPARMTAAGGISPAERYRLLFERNLAGVFRATLDGRLLECNESCARIFGYASPEEVAGFPVTEVYFDPAERAAVVEQIQRQGALSNLEMRLRRRYDPARAARLSRRERRVRKRLCRHADRSEEQDGEQHSDHQRDY